jgi:hypothetical protein
MRFHAGRKKTFCVRAKICEGEGDWDWDWDCDFTWKKDEDLLEVKKERGKERYLLLILSSFVLFFVGLLWRLRHTHKKQAMSEVIFV